MSLSLFLTAWLGVISLTTQPLRIVTGAPPPVPVAAGEVWLIGNRWGAYPGILVATIRNGSLEALQETRFPRYWEQAFNYTLLVAVSTRPVNGPRPSSQDSAYGPSGRPPYLKPFPVIYVSTPMPTQSLGLRWEDALRRMGRVVGGTLALPLPIRRTIRLEYPGGKPLAGAHVNVMLFGSQENHCGAPVGIELGAFTSDRNGEISFVATNSPLALDEGYFDVRPGGPAGTIFSAGSALILDGAQHMTVKRLWTLPQYDYVLRLRTPENRAVANARLTACDNFDGCGAGCGPLPGVSDSSGVMRFRSPDLREMRSLTVVNEAKQERQLTRQEMRKLLTSHRLGVTWQQ